MITKKDSPKEDFNTIKTNGNENFETFKFNDESMSSSFGTMIIKDDVGTNVTKTKPSGLKKSESQYEKIFVNDYVPKTLLDSVDGQGLSEMARAKILIRNEVKYRKPTGGILYNQLLKSLKVYGYDVDMLCVCLC